MSRQLGRLTLLAALTSLVVLSGHALSLAAPAGTTHLPDLQTIIPTSGFSVVNNGGVREFRYTHLVYDNGPGPLEVRPQYSQASGNYQGYQQYLTHNAAGAWSVQREVRVPDAFVFHAAHGHFHFPLAAFGLYAVAADGGPGAPVAVSPKNGFCISDSYIYNQTVEHSGFFLGAQGSCADPTTMRGLSVGGADEYDYRDPGQAIPINGVPDGTYWFRAMSDPNNDFAEANEANNESDVKVTISNGTVTAGETRAPDTTPPPVALTGPADAATVKGTITLTADSPVTGAGSVQFIVDGNFIGSSSDAASPQRLGWDTTTVVDGVHWIAARATDAQGRTSTSAVAAVNVANAAAPPPPPPGVLGLDGAVSTDGRGTVTTPGLTTSQGGDLLLAFVTSDGPASANAQTMTVSGGGLSWSLVKRQNARYGTTEIWKAVAPTSLAGLAVTSTPANGGFDQSITVQAFANASGVGAASGASAASGAPTTSLTTTKAGSWVFGAGNDWDNAIARTLASGQMPRHQWVDTAVGDTFWVQAQGATTTNAGTLVTTNATAPITDQWNMASVEVVAATPSTPPPPDTTPPLVVLSDPTPGKTVGGTIALAATASDDVGVASVQFKVDGTAVGAPVTAPPFMTQWDTRSVSAGSHTVTAEAQDAAGNVGASAGVPVTVDNTAPPPATVAIDTSQSVHATGTLRSPALTTADAGELLLAFVALDGPKGSAGNRSTVTGAGLTWTLVKRADSQSGVSEVWSAKASSKLTRQVVTATPQRGGYDGLLHVIAFRNAASVGVAGASGAPAGAPDIYLPGTTAGSWVFAVGNDWDRAVARTPSAGQVLRHQWVDTRTGDTFWVQSPTAPNTVGGLVTIHDTAPTTDQFNYAAAEVVAAPGG